MTVTNFDIEANAGSGNPEVLLVLRGEIFILCQPFRPLRKERGVRQSTTLLAACAVWPLLGIIAALTLILASPKAANAELTPAMLTQKIQAATAGEMSLDELAELVLREAEESDRSLQILLGDDRKVPGFGQHLSVPLLKHLQDALSKGADDKANRLIELSRKYIPEGTSNAPTIERIAKWMADLKAVMTANDIPQFIELYHDEDVGIPAEALEGRLEIALKQYAEGIAAKYQPLEALSMLSILDAATSKPVLAEIGKGLLPKAVESLSKEPPPVWTFDSQEAQDFLKMLAHRDETSMQSVIQLLRWVILDRMKQNNSGEAQWYFNMVLGLRPDPNPENIQLRKDIAFAATGPESKKFADGRLEELRQAGALGAMTKLQLATSGIGGGLFRVVVIIAEIIGALLIGWFVWRYVVRMNASRAVRGKPAAKKRSASAKGYDQPMERDDEYTRLLATFGLDDDATEADIKRAFREAVKRHHPDVQGAEGVSRDDEGNVDDTFQELRRNYERLLEVRGGWFGRRSS